MQSGDFGAGARAASVPEPGVQLEAILSSNVGIVEASFVDHRPHVHLEHLKRIVVCGLRDHGVLGFCFCELGQPKVGLSPASREVCEQVFRDAFTEARLAPPRIYWAKDEALACVFRNDVNVVHDKLITDLDPVQNWRCAYVVDVQRDYGTVRIINTHQPKSNQHHLSTRTKKNVIEKIGRHMVAPGISGAIVVGDLNITPQFLVNCLSTNSLEHRMFFSSLHAPAQHKGNPETTGLDLGYSCGLDIKQVDTRVPNRPGANHETVIAAWLPPTRLCRSDISAAELDDDLGKQAA